MKRKRIGVTRPTDGLDKLFIKRGWDATVLPLFKNLKEEPDLDYIAFSGGVDVAPELYGHERHPFSDPVDWGREESDIDYHSLYRSIPKIGVCRGAQFLSVMNGSYLYQHIHSQEHNGNHTVVDVETGAPVRVTSVHHQACVVKDGWRLLAVARTACPVEGESRKTVNEDCYVPEAFYIPQDTALCVQFHPEYNHLETENYFFELFERLKL